MCVRTCIYTFICRSRTKNDTIGALAMCHVTMLCISGIGVPVYVLPGRTLVYTYEQWTKYEVHTRGKK